MAPVSSKTTTCSTGLLITGYLGKRWNGGSPDGQCVPRTIIMSTQLLISQGAPVLSWTWDSFRITKMKIWCAGSSNLLSSLTRHVSRNMLYLSTHSSLPCRFEIAEKRQLPQSTSHMSICECHNPRCNLVGIFARVRDDHACDSSEVLKSWL